MCTHGGPWTETCGSKARPVFPACLRNTQLTAIYLVSLKAATESCVTFPSCLATDWFVSLHLHSRVRTRDCMHAPATWKGSREKFFRGVTNVLFAKQIQVEVRRINWERCEGWKNAWFLEVFQISKVALEMYVVLKFFIFWKNAWFWKLKKNIRFWKFRFFKFLKIYGFQNFQILKKMV